MIIQSDEKKLPVEEMLAFEEFTDRDEILRELDSWVKNIQRMISPSTAIISPRKMGKTVLFDRLVNTIFFKPEYKVAPFYFRVKREDTTLKDFLLEYATTFFRQYIAYCHQEADLYRDNSIKLENLLDYTSQNKAVNLAKKFIEGFLNRYQDARYKDTRNQWDGFIKVPEYLGSDSGIRVAVIIDEFQDMKFYIHNVDEHSITQIRNERLHNPDILGVNLTATYDRQSQSRKAPMLVSSSAVTMIFRVVLGGALAGRFDLTYLKPLSIPDGATLLRCLLDIYLPGETIEPENALYASTQTGGHPYYLYCLTMSKFEKKKFDSKKAIDNLIRYEIENGKIYGFWQTHFDYNRRYINADDDEQTGRKIIYYFTEYNNQEVDIKEIAKKLKIPKNKVEEKIEKLYSADLVYRTAARFYAFNDICLMRFIKFVYEKDMEGLEEIDLSQQKIFNNLKGRFLEIAAQITMMKFNNEQVEGKFFGRSGTIEAPLFKFVNTKIAKAVRSRQYQIDVYAEERWNERVWICECKYTKAKMGMGQVKKLEDAGRALKQEAEDEEVKIPEIRMWLLSTGGFTGEVLEYVKDREDIYYSDYEGINGIFRSYGSNYNIPVFKKTPGAKVPK